MNARFCQTNANQPPLPNPPKQAKLKPEVSLTLDKSRGKREATSVPPIAHRLVADLNTTLVKQVFNVTQRQRETNVQHHRQAEDLWARLEVAEIGTLAHPEKLMKRRDRLKQSSSDNARSSQSSSGTARRRRPDWMITPARSRSFQTKGLSLTANFCPYRHLRQPPT
jgi:hypothetical protein